MNDLIINNSETHIDESPVNTARVTAVHRGRYELLCGNDTIFGKLKTSAFYDNDEEIPTVGDIVSISLNPFGDSSIIKTLPRKSCFFRKDPGPIPRKQMVAANFDYVFIMSSLNQDFNTRRISRYLTMAWQSGGYPVVVLTKADLCDDSAKFTADAENVASGAPVIAVSSVTGDGLDRLGEYLSPGKTIVFLGMSGIGKSSLLNALAGQELMVVKGIREDDSRGRHTTTHRQLAVLPSGAMIIDTPGMRELGLWDADEGVSASFQDVEELFSRCRFTDCGHKNEPGCAVVAALEDGSLSREQWGQYLTQKREAAYTDNKTAYLRERSAKSKSISKSLRSIKKKGDKH